MKNNIIKLIASVIFISTVSICYCQQLDIEINETNKAGIKIRNLNTSNASATNLDFYNDGNDLFQLGITGQFNRFFSLPRVAYLFTLGGQDIPIAFATNGKERMRIDSEGRLGIGRDNSLSSLVSIYNDGAHKGRDALFIVQDSANSAIEIISYADNYPALQIDSKNQASGAFINVDSSSALSLTTGAGVSPTLSASQAGTGNCARFTINNSLSNNSAVRVSTNANGQAIYAENTGSGSAADFTSSSSFSSVIMNNVGTGHSLFVRGTAMRFDADPNWDTTSDKRLKKDIRKFEDGLDVIKSINPVFFTYNGLCGISSENENVGIIAQEIQEIAPYMVSKEDMLLYPDQANNQEVMKDVLTYNPTALPYILVNAVKTLNAKIASQESHIKNQTAVIQNLTNKLEKLENLVSKNNIQ